MMKKLAFISLLATLLPVVASSQFEESKLNGKDFEKPNVRLGADFAMQYQMISHHADSALIPLGTGFNLPTANMIIESQLAPGIKVNLTTYLSSRHHNETWVKGGYLIIDQLPFLKSERLDRAMDYLTLKVGDMDINFGDAHFRRSDNGHVISNPFVGNYIIDAFSTQIAAELMFRSDGLLLMGALSTGSLKPALAGYSPSTGYSTYDTHRELAFYWKGGYDKQVTDEWRLRLTLSGYHSPNHHFGSLYNGDRAGSRYYLVMNRVTNSPNDVDITKNHTSGSWSPGFTDRNNAFMANLFSRYKGFEVFGTFEKMNGTTLAGSSVEFSQYAAEGLYRFGNEEQFYCGLRYNKAWNKNDQNITRFQAAAGWNMLESVLLKLEYVNQDYNGFISQYGAEAGFKGMMAEAAISF